MYGIWGRVKELRVSAKEGIGRGFSLPPPSAGLYHSHPTEKHRKPQDGH